VSVIDERVNDLVRESFDSRTQLGHSEAGVDNEPGPRVVLKPGGARGRQAGLVGDWVADAPPWGFRLADVGVRADIWIGERAPGRAPLDAPEIKRRIPSCTLHADPDAGHWLLIPRWPDVLEQSLGE
jgi:hypothetical protein